MVLKFNIKLMKIGRYLVGLVSGLTFGMLFATKKGKDLRKELFEKGSESHMEGLKVLGNAFKGAGADAMTELRKISEHEDVAALIEVSQDKMRSFLDAAQDHGYDVAAYVQEKLEGLACMAKDKACEMKGDADQFQRRAVRKAEGIRDEVMRKVSPIKKAVAKKARKSAKRK
jgi:gas vesicle protein